MWDGKKTRSRRESWSLFIRFHETQRVPLTDTHTHPPSKDGGRQNRRVGSINHPWSAGRQRKRFHSRYRRGLPLGRCRYPLQCLVLGCLLARVECHGPSANRDPFNFPTGAGEPGGAPPRVSLANHVDDIVIISRVAVRNRMTFYLWL